LFGESIANLPWQNLENAILSRRFAVLTINFDAYAEAVIKFVDESGSINYCTCELHSDVFLRDKKIRTQ